LLTCCHYNNAILFYNFAGESVIVIGVCAGKPLLFGSGVVLPGRQLHFEDIREDSCKISMSTISGTCPDDAKPFYQDKNGENRLVVGQIYEWPRTYLFPSKNFKLLKTLLEFTLLI
jgi:hypothetical protein